MALLDKCYAANPLQQNDADMSPWEEIFDKAATEGTSLRLVFCDKGAKADLEKKTAARLEGRPKVPVGTYQVGLVSGDTVKSVPTVEKKPEEKGDIEWLLDASIKGITTYFPGHPPGGGGLVDMPPVSTVWLSATQTKGLAGIKPMPLNPPVANGEQPGLVPNAAREGGVPVDENAAQMEQMMPNGGDAFSVLKRDLVGKKCDQNSNWMTVEEYSPPVHDKLMGTPYIHSGAGNLTGRGEITSSAICCPLFASSFTVFFSTEQAKARAGMGENSENSGTEWAKTLLESCAHVRKYA
eukprot:g8936.t1